MLIDEGKGPFLNEVRRVLSAFFARISGKREEVVAHAKVVGIIAVCQALAVVTEKGPEALSEGAADRPREAQSPLAKGSGGITRTAQQRGDGQRAFGQGSLAFWKDLLVAADGRVARVQAGQQAGSARGADRGTGIVTGETHPFPRHAVQIRSADILLAVAAEIAVAQVVGEDVNDVWTSGGRRVAATQREAGEESE
jgi:hypothetical protein